MAAKVRASVIDRWSAWRWNRASRPASCRHSQIVLGTLGLGCRHRRAQTRPQTFWICRLSAISVPSSTEYLENAAASLALTNTTGTPRAFSLRSSTVTFPRPRLKSRTATSPGQCVPPSRNDACSPPELLHGRAGKTAQRIDNDNSGEVDGRVIDQGLNGASWIAAARAAYAARPDAVISVERSPFSHSRPSSHPG